LYEHGSEARAAAMFLKGLALLEQNRAAGGRLPSEYAVTFAAIGRGLYDLGRAVEADRAATAALALDPGNVEALDCRGLLLASRGNTEEARASFTRALAVDPTRTEAWGNLGDLEYAVGERDAATVAWSNVLRLDRLDVDTYDKLLRLRPGDADLWFQKAEVTRELERREESLAAYEHVLHVDPRSGGVAGARAGAPEGPPARPCAAVHREGAGDRR